MQILILSNDATAWMHEGPIVSNEGTVRVHKIPIVSHEGTAWVDSVFSGSLFIIEQTLSEIKKRLFYRDQILIGNKKSPAYIQ